MKKKTEKEKKIRNISLVVDEEGYELIGFDEDIK
jgi:hypothetical protein